MLCAPPQVLQDGSDVVTVLQLVVKSDRHTSSTRRKRSIKGDVMQNGESEI